MPAVQLDPFQLIVNVGWGGADIIVLEVSYDGSFRNEPPSLPFRLSAAWLDQDHDAFDAVIKEPSGVVAPIINPISGDMLSGLTIWNVDPFVVEEEATVIGSFEVIDRGLYDIVAGNVHVTEHTDPLAGKVIPFIIDWNNEADGGAEDPREINAVNLSDWLNQLNSMLSGIIDEPPREHLEEILVSHFDLTTRTTYHRAGKAAIFLNARKIRLLLDPDNNLTFSVQTPLIPGGDGGVNDGFVWSVLVRSYKAERDFPLNSENEPQWVFSPISLTDQDGQKIEGVDDLKSYHVNIIAEPLTLLLDSEKIEA
jgi:hypothetical protein